ncbi:MAG: TolC family protein [Gemmataceae bacterium]
MARSVLRALNLITVAGAVVAVVGCSRQAYRERADQDVEGVITQKNIAEEWKVENWNVYPDARARFADPSCPDFPPYPPDDYTAHVLSPNPQHPGQAGTGRYEGDGYLKMIQEWDAANRAEDAEEDKKAQQSADPNAAPAPPPARNSLTSDAVPFRMRLDQLVELAFLNAREFQDRREDLYLAALPVTQQRFSFAAQALAAENIVREWAGADTAGGAGNRWRVGTSAGVSRTFATGGQLLVNLANQIVVDFNGPKPTVSLSNLSFTFLQPLLRGGGYAVTLEALTAAERNLLYAIRSYARFRKVFYVVIVGQGDYTNNPYGLQGLSVNLGRAIGTNLTAPIAGYLPTILQAATLANQQLNVASLEQFHKLFINLREGGQTSELQIVRVEQQLLQGRTQVLSLQRTYLDSVDSLKLQLGVPATLPIELDDRPLRPIRQQLQRFEAVYADLGAVQATAEKVDLKEEPVRNRARWMRLFTESGLVRGTQFSKKIAADLAPIAKLSNAELEAAIKSAREKNRKLLDAKSERELAGKPEPANEARAIEVMENTIELHLFEQSLRTYETAPWKRLPAERQATERTSLFRNVFESGMLVIVRAKNERLSALRAQWPVLPVFSVDGQDIITCSLDEAYLKTGQSQLTNRLDLMNARGQVVDAWRQIAVTANALLGQFDVTYNLTTTTPTTTAAPFGFSTGRTLQQLSLRFDPPFVRRVERNAYRAALIGYQRQRRILMAFEDNIITDGRQDLRQLRQLAESYKIQQRAIEIAYAQVDNARNTFIAPPDPGLGGGGNAQANVAALTEQLLTAQGALVQAQNQLFQTWINYLTTRLNLALDLELLTLDTRGFWNDVQLNQSGESVRPPNP